MVLFSIVLGIIAFAVFFLILHLIDKAYEVNTLLGLGILYLVFNFLNEKIADFLPKSWTIKQIKNEFVLDNGLGFFLHLNQPKLSAYELTITTLRLCIVGYFIYGFGFKEVSWRK
nr:hypothetical protein [uncultured Allomuricauda sp.]